MDFDIVTFIAICIALPIVGFIFGTILALISGEDFKESLRTGGYMCIIAIGLLFTFSIGVLIIAGIVFLLTEV